MKKNLLKIIPATFLLFVAAITGNVHSQTAGTFTFTLTTTSAGGFSPSHLIAIWIENNAAAFVKTKLKRSATGNLDHLEIWVGKSGLNVIDATTGATLTSHGAITVIWNGTDVNGALVPDGSYNVWVEMAWAASLTTGKTSVSFPFTKGSSTFHSAPANLTNFTGITLDWVPGSTLVKNIAQSTQINVFPNPTSSFVNIEFKQTVTNCNVQVLNVDGKEVYQTLVKSIKGIKTIDLSKLPAGVYFISVQNGKNNLNYRVVKK